jgi:hypothetical protein
MEFDGVVQELNLRMLTEHPAVDASRNPVALRLASLGPDALRLLMGQYSLFSKNISAFLMDAYFAMAHAEWWELADELTQNIGEEFALPQSGRPAREGASGPRPVPHYILLRRGLQEGLGLDVARVTPSVATREFIAGIKLVVNDPNPARVAGGAYGLESSAVPELEMVYGFAKRLFELECRPVSKGIAVFFESHISELEVGHEQRLKRVCERYIGTVEARSDYASGFFGVLSTLDRWWEGLSEEIAEPGRRVA